MGTLFWENACAGLDNVLDSTTMSQLDEFIAHRRPPAFVNADYRAEIMNPKYDLEYAIGLYCGKE
jgi:hypothetical protein